MTQPLLDYLQAELADGRRLGVFSCEDPLNTPFHRDILALSSYVHLKVTIGARVDLASVELGTVYKGVNSWIVVGHSDGLQVCRAVAMVMSSERRAPRHLQQELDAMGLAHPFDDTLENNVRSWARCQAGLLREYADQLQQTDPRVSSQEIRVRAGMIRHEGEFYASEVLDY